MSFFRRYTMFFNELSPSDGLRRKNFGSPALPTKAEWSHSKSMWVQRRRSSSGISLGVRQNADQRLLLHPETCVRKSLLFRRTLPFQSACGVCAFHPCLRTSKFQALVSFIFRGHCKTYGPAGFLLRVCADSEVGSRLQKTCLTDG